MIVSIHQPSYFPWFGLLDKIAKSDLYILMDEVQLADRAYQHRNMFITKEGKEKILTIGIDKKNYRSKKLCEIEINSNSNWQIEHKNFLTDSYKKAKYFDEIWIWLNPIFEKKYNKLIEVLEDSMQITLQLLDIKTAMKKQSDLEYNRDTFKSDLILDLCLATHAEIYLSGQGAKDYMELDKFEKENIEVVFQLFKHPVYNQLYSDDFIIGLSILDCLFNNGVEETRRLFWNNLQKEDKL